MFTRLTLLTLVAAACSVRVAAAAEVFTPHHVARLRACSSATMAPDGAHVAYRLSVPRRPFEDDSGPSYAELHVVDLNGTSRPFITGPVSVGDLDWTPDGTAISFTSKRGDDEHACLYVIPIDGGESRRVLAHDTGIGAYSWHPAGTHVAFLATPKAPEDQKKRADQGFNAEVYEEDVRATQLWIGRPHGDPWSRPDGKHRLIELDGSCTAVKWSPDGARLAVGVAPSPRIDDRYMQTRIHIIDVEGGTVERVLETEGKLGAFEWSPDGQHLALIAAIDINDPAEGRLWVTPVSGGGWTDLLPDYMGHVTSIAWQGNDTVMYLGDVGLYTEFGKVDIGSGTRTVLVEADAHVLDGLTLAADGMSGAMLGQGPTHPTEVFTMAHGQDRPRRLTTSNPWLADMRFARQEAVEFAARDGMAIQGVLIRPLDEQPGRRYPLILVVHGGPEAHERMGWLTYYSRPGQVGAARGFAVFYPNYRGSTGRGVAFSKLGQADYGGKEFDDLIDSVDHLVGSGLVDTHKVGVTGGSYGGFASAWCATRHTSRFAASVMFVGISDQISKFGTTDIPNEMYHVHSRTWPWDDWTFFRERSPITYAQQARTPILIMHGREDTRVHPSQSMELYRYLKTLGQVPVRLVLYPGEGHGNRKSAARLDYNLRLMRWMEHYLQGDGGAPPTYHIDYDAIEKEVSGDDDDDSDSDSDSDSDDDDDEDDED